MHAQGLLDISRTVNLSTSYRLTFSIISYMVYNVIMYRLYTIKEQQVTQLPVMSYSKHNPTIIAFTLTSVPDTMLYKFIQLVKISAQYKDNTLW